LKLAVTIQRKSQSLLCRSHASAYNSQS